MMSKNKYTKEFDFEKADVGIIGLFAEMFLALLIFALLVDVFTPWIIDYFSLFNSFKESGSFFLSTFSLLLTVVIFLISIVTIVVFSMFILRYIKYKSKNGYKVKE